MDAERRSLAAAARDRFVAQIRELGLDAEQVDQLVRDIQEAAR